MNRFYQGDWIDNLASRFIDELPHENIKKNNYFEEDQEDDFEFNQDIDFENEIKSPGWIRYQKKLKR
jgi:DNA helicase-2/ATP-dependent DNA helicase PcrA